MSRLNLSPVARSLVQLLGAMAIAGLPGCIYGGSDTTGAVESSSAALTGDATVSIRGTVRGLKGIGLILENNGTDAIAVGSDGTFFFPTPLRRGEAYEVTVDQLPSPHQECEVHAGSGVTDSSDVTEVVVDCSPKTHTVGGSANGLDAVGLVLELKGENDSAVALSTDGTFTFASAIASGATYSVEIIQQPSGETCAVQYGDGTITDSDVTSVRVACVNDEVTLSGSVTGLASHILLSNGDDLVSVVGDGTFTMPHKLAVGASFDVEVVEQPGEPEQVCIVQGGRGVVASDMAALVVACSNP